MHRERAVHLRHDDVELRHHRDDVLELRRIRLAASRWRWGHASVVILLAGKGQSLRWLTDRLAAVGQMAFSNYISHSIIYAVVFYTPGSGVVRTAAAVSAVPRRPRYLDTQSGMESHLAALFPLRPAGVVLALADLLAAAADAASCPGACGRLRVGIGWIVRKPDR